MSHKQAKFFLTSKELDTNDIKEISLFLRENTKTLEKEKVLCSSEDAYYYFNVLHMAEGMDVETMFITFLDAKNRIIATDLMFRGSISSCSIYPREIIKKVLEYKASAIVMSHNHPSGSIEPSMADKKITKYVLYALQSINVEFHDHIICGNSEHYSFATIGYMQTYREDFTNFTNEI